MDTQAAIRSAMMTADAFECIVTVYRSKESASNSTAATGQITHRRYGRPDFPCYEFASVLPYAWHTFKYRG